MNRAELQQLAEMRLSDAQVLLATGANDSGAYYMAGYAIECALKAVIAKNQGEYPFPLLIKDADLRQRYYTHDLVVLLTTAQLEVPFGIAQSAKPTLTDCWNAIKAWNETIRYDVQVPRRQAEDLIQAISDPIDGVLTWLRNHW